MSSLNYDSIEKLFVKFVFKIVFNFQHSTATAPYSTSVLFSQSKNKPAEIIYMQSCNKTGEIGSESIVMTGSQSIRVKYLNTVARGAVITQHTLISLQVQQWKQYNNDQIHKRLSLIVHSVFDKIWLLFQKTSGLVPSHEMGV